ncbi:MAG: formylglycine-generating enzyme family protein, partial [Bacteroidota bacterium]
NDASTVAQGESLVQTEIKTTNETLNTEISENSNTYAENSNNYKIFSESDKTQVEEKITQLVTKLTIGLTTEFPMIPGAAGSSNGKSFQVAFYMWPNEVTVSEYELFLNHLLLNGNYQEFESYRPNLNNHSVSSLSDEDVAFFHQYFTDEKYSNHPVIFVSAEGAQAYCKWLQDLVNQQNKFEQNKTTVVRLPSKWEWERAAAGGKEHIDYGTADGQLATGFMHHNPEANYREYQRNSFSFTNTKTQKKEKHLTQFFQFTTPVKSFKPNSYGLFDMSGNVSEMVIDMNGKIMTKGGNWNSSKEFLKIRDDDFNEFPKGAIASPFIGFRPVLNFN